MTLAPRVRNQPAQADGSLFTQMGTLQGLGCETRQHSTFLPSKTDKEWLCLGRQTEGQRAFVCSSKSSTSL